jgi:hypothetical protein
LAAGAGALLAVLDELAALSELPDVALSELLDALSELPLSLDDVDELSELDPLDELDLPPRESVL